MNSLHLLFVYNANSDLFSSVTDFAHKIISPQTYNCSLCALTYGNLTIKQEWKSFLKELPAEKTFLHKDEFEKRYKQSFGLPAIFYLKANQPVVLLGSDDINRCTSLNELITALLHQLQLLKSSPA
jgi:hypothetical protein